MDFHYILNPPRNGIASMTYATEIWKTKFPLKPSIMSIVFAPFKHLKLLKYLSLYHDFLFALQLYL